MPPVLPPRGAGLLQRLIAGPSPLNLDWAPSASSSPDPLPLKATVLRGPPAGGAGLGPQSPPKPSSVPWSLCGPGPPCPLGRARGFGGDGARTSNPPRPQGGVMKYY